MGSDDAAHETLPAGAPPAAGPGDEGSWRLREADKAEQQQLMEKFRHYRATGDRAVRNELVESCRWIAAVASRRFTNRGEPFDDLLQVAQLGVLKAVERFDPEYGSSFATFALPTVMGELRRHFRDATWAVRVNRRAKELHLALSGAVESLTHDLGRPPRLEEIAARLDVSEDHVLEAIEAGWAYRTSSLSQRAGEDGPGDDARALAFEDLSLAGAETRVALRELLNELAPRERRIVFLRFFEDLTQNEIAQQVGVSQVHVSRLLRASLEELRRRLGEAGVAPSPRPSADLAPMTRPR
ncbi:MAG: SigB/SigF/SigG family RNA polymerase sigma factor [Acidimicrobiales bacterium]